MPLGIGLAAGLLQVQYASARRTARRGSTADGDASLALAFPDFAIDYDDAALGIDFIAESHDNASHHYSPAIVYSRRRDTILQLGKPPLNVVVVGIARRRHCHYQNIMSSAFASFGVAWNGVVRCRRRQIYR